MLQFLLHDKQWVRLSNFGYFLTGTTAPPDPTEHQINMAIVGINNAKTEAAAAAAAATIYSPALDMSDNVKQALENKIRQLRTPAGWVHPIPPPLPFGFDVMHVIMNSFYGGPVTAAPMVANPAPAAIKNQGPPTSIIRGPSPGKRRREQIQQPNALQQNSRNAVNTQHDGLGQTNTQQQQQQPQQQQPAGIDWNQLANTYPGLFDPFHFNHLNTNPGFWW